MIEGFPNTDTQINVDNMFQYTSAGKILHPRDSVSTNVSDQ